MRDHYEWDRTTVNFYRYVGDRVDIVDRSHLVIYVPRNNGPEVPTFREGEFIISRMTEESLELKPYGEPVRERILRPIRPRVDLGDDYPELIESRRLVPGTYEATIQGVRKIGEKTIAIDLETKDLDPLAAGRTIHTQLEREISKSHGVWYGDWRYRVRDIEQRMVDIGFFNFKVDQLRTRLDDLEKSTMTLFKAVYWILRKFRVVK